MKTSEVAIELAQAVKQSSGEHNVGITVRFGYSTDGTTAPADRWEAILHHAPQDLQNRLESDDNTVRAAGETAHALALLAAKLMGRRTKQADTARHNATTLADAIARITFRAP